MRLVFPESSEDWTDAFSNALAVGVVVRDSQAKNFWGRFQFLASDVAGGEVVADWFHDIPSDIFIRVERKGNLT